MLTNLIHETTLWGKYNDYPDFYRWENWGQVTYKDHKGVCCIEKDMAMSKPVSRLRLRPMTSERLRKLVCDFSFFFFFWLCHVVCGIFPQPGIEPVPPAVEAQSSNHWTARELPVIILIDCFILTFAWRVEFSEALIQTLCAKMEIVKKEKPTSWLFLTYVSQWHVQGSLPTSRDDWQMGRFALQFLVWQFLGIQRYG